MLNAAFQIIRGGVIPMDVATVEMADGEKCYMTQSVSLGLTADADVESVKFRMFGESRFILGEIFLNYTSRGTCFACPLLHPIWLSSIT